jgi:hypothetical protein
VNADKNILSTLLFPGVPALYFFVGDAALGVPPVKLIETGRTVEQYVELMNNGYE